MRIDAAELKQTLIQREMKCGLSLAKALEKLSRKYPELFDAPAEKPKKLKHNNKITIVDGVSFRSKLEAEYYSQLKLRFMAGEIIGFVIQPKFILQEGTETERAITYSADFLIIFPDMSCEVIDTKGFEGKEWQRTYKMFRIKYPKIELRVIKN